MHDTDDPQEEEKALALFETVLALSMTCQDIRAMVIPLVWRTITVCKLDLAESGSGSLVWLE
jgi:hypothetical protein